MRMWRKGDHDPCPESSDTSTCHFSPRSLVYMLKLFLMDHLMDRLLVPVNYKARLLLDPNITAYLAPRKRNYVMQTATTRSNQPHQWPNFRGTASGGSKMLLIHTQQAAVKRSFVLEMTKVESLATQSHVLNIRFHASSVEVSAFPLCSPCSWSYSSSQFGHIGENHRKRR